MSTHKVRTGKSFSDTENERNIRIKLQAQIKCNCHNGYDSEEVKNINLQETLTCLSTYSDALAVLVLVTGVPRTTDRGTTNRERERRFRCNFYTVGAISFPRSRPERSFPERGTLHRSRSAVTKVLVAEVEMCIELYIL